MTLTPEAEVSSTVVNNSFQSNEGDSSNSNPTFSKSMNTLPTVIPPTTIVCLPSVVSVSNPVISRQHGMPVTSSSVIQNIGETKIKIENQNSSSPINIVQHKQYQSLQKVLLQNQQHILQHHNQQLQQQQHQQQSTQHQNLQTLINQNTQQKQLQVTFNDVAFLGLKI